MSQSLILTAALTGTKLTTIIMGQIPVVATMIIAGYLAVLRNTPVVDNATREAGFRSQLRSFLLWFSPIASMIILAAFFGIDVSVASLVGVALLLLITKPPREVLAKIALTHSLYMVVLAAYGAMLLRSVTLASGISDILGQIIGTWKLGEGVMLAALPIALGVFVGSTSGSIAISVPILTGMLDFSPSSASLLYTSAFMGYLVSPTHLCLAWTAEYFGCPLSKVYRLLVPSLVVSFAVALLFFYSL
jgi:hypothetical protein